MLINKAMSNKKLKLKIFRNNSGSGTLNDDFGSDHININNQEEKNIENIPVKKFFNILKNYKNKITIKIDVQGSEYSILKEIFKIKNISSIKNIIFEIILN